MADKSRSLILIRCGLGAATGAVVDSGGGSRGGGNRLLTGCRATTRGCRTDLHQAHLKSRRLG